MPIYVISIFLHFKITFQGGVKFLQETMSRLTVSTDANAAAANSDLVIEAIVENLDVKKKLFSSLDQAAPQYVPMTSMSPETVS